jgi:ribosomal protein S18 acetylase RimI-like enzyme
MVQWGGCVGEQARAAFPGYVEINHLQVRPEHRGRGVGTAIIRAAEVLIGSRGIVQVAVSVASDNPSAARLYLRLGYQPTGVFDICEYNWFDQSDEIHHAIEHADVLTKRLDC